MNKVTFGNNIFCGPSVISAIAGISTDEAAAILTSITGKKEIRGVYLSDVTKSFEKLGFEVTQLPVSGSIFTMMYQLNGNDGYYVFLIKGHFVAIEVNGNHRYICDNHTKEPINVGNSARLAAKVIGMIKVTKKEK